MRVTVGLPAALILIARSAQPRFLAQETGNTIYFVWNEPEQRGKKLKDESSPRLLTSRLVVGDCFAAKPFARTPDNGGGGLYTTLFFFSNTYRGTKETITASPRKSLF